MVHPFFVTDYGGKAFVDSDGQQAFAELKVRNELAKYGWEARWVRGTRFVKDMRRFSISSPVQDDNCPLPPAAQVLYDRIVEFNGGRRGGCWDVLAWRENAHLFVECKRAVKDQIQESQRQWLEAALRAGTDLDSFLIAEWRLTVPGELSDRGANSESEAIP